MVIIQTVEPMLSIQLILVLSALFVGLVCYITFLWKKRHMFMKSWKCPGPLNLPLIGAAYLFMCRPEYVLERVSKLQQKYPLGLKLWFGNRLIYCLHEPQHIEKVLGSSRLIQKDILYKHLVDSIGEGLLVAPAHVWKKHRKHIVGSFSQKVLDSFVGIFVEESEILADIFAENVEKEVDVLSLISSCTMNIFAETAMGVKLNAQRSNTQHVQNLDKIMKMTFLKIFQIWNHSDFIWRILGHKKKLEGHLKQFNDLVDRVIEKKLTCLNRNPKSSMKHLTNENQQLAFLDYIIQSGQFTPEELRDEVNIFMFAGTDTTASSMSFILAILGMFPDIQQKVYEEVIEVLGKHRKPLHTDLPYLVYTERVIKETLRLFPVGSFFLRTITEDVDMGDFIVPKGASAWFGLLFIHRNPNYWPDPLKFDPDRFLPEEVAKRHPCTYIPFSYGPRNCIGRVYGMLNMKVMIATLIRRLTIHCGYKRIEDIDVKSNIVLRFKKSAKVSFTRRN